MLSPVRTLMVIVIAALSFLPGSCKRKEIRVVYQIKQQGTPGTSCTVVDGSNKGKTGTYDNEGACCEKVGSDGEEAPGNGWCTECKKNGTSNGKCQDKPRVIVSDYFDIEGARNLVVEAYYELPDGRIVHGLTTLPVDSQAAPKTDTTPLEVRKISDLRNSADPMNKLIAASVESSLREKKLVK